MKYINIQDDIMNFKLNEDVIVTIGNFDGLHRMHRLIFHKVQNIAGNSKLKKVLITFDKKISDKKDSFAGRILSPTEFKKRLEKNFEFDYVIELEISKKLIETGVDNFLKWLSNNLNVKKIVIGEDFSFGHKAEGKVNDLKKHFGKSNVYVETRNGDISSSLVKKALANGELRKVNFMLVEPIVFVFNDENKLIFPETAVKSGTYSFHDLNRLRTFDLDENRYANNLGDNRIIEVLKIK
ncbi:hypothetical protein [Spiroplasma endosymbiont of Labia minor]|uniref:hypothetical protein n=1 Tax=Spiroplasma endosymbiont of Labia minor TaxID=3066305 RepID=UPI0030D1C9EC